MGVSAGCLEVFVTDGPALYRFHQAESPTVVDDDRVYAVARETMPPRGIVTLIPESALASDSLRAHLHDVAVANDGRLVVIPFRGGSAGLLDLDSALRVQERLGLALGVPASALPGGVPTHLDGRLIAAGPAADGGAASGPALAYRLLPEALAANHRQLAELIEAGQPPSMTRLVSYSAASGGRTAGGGGLLTGDLSPLAGVYYARFGEMPTLPLADLLAARTPLFRQRLNAALGGEPVPMRLANVLQEFRSGRAAAALVHAPPGSPTPGSSWLVQDDTGQLRWATGVQQMTPVDLDGANDRRTAVLEHPYTEFVVVTPRGEPYRPELPAEPPWTPRVSANARRLGTTILLGPDGPSAVTEEITAALNHHDGLKVLVNVRRGARTERGTTLDELTAEALHHTLANNPNISVVVATEHNDQLTFIAADQHGRSVVQPVMVGFDKFWEVQGARSPAHQRYHSLGTSALTHAKALAFPPKAGPSPLVAGLVTQPTWSDVEAYMKRFAVELRDPRVAQELAELRSASVANGRRISRFGTERLEDHPFHRPDRTTAAFQVLIEQDLRAQDRGNLGGRPLEPQHARLTEAIEPHTRTADSTLSLGYLTTRPLAAARLGEEVGGYLTGLLWFREVVQAAIDVDKTQFSLADARAVVAAKGELEEERAARGPGQPEIYRAHADIVEMIDRFTGAERPRADWRDGLKAIDCLPGADRVLWHFMLTKILIPAFSDHESEFKELQNRIITCHGRVGA